MTSESDPLIGRRIDDRYLIVDEIARGGMARVYRARDERLDRDVAIKILAEPYASDPAFADRFLAEARTAAGLTHTNLVHVYDSGQEGDARFIVMELLGGYRTLRDRLAEGRMPAAEAVDVARELLAGLGLVHDRGLVHCDVKAANVMVGDGPVKLIDFGIARTPAGSGTDGSSLGSLHAMPPEQLRGEPLTAASDLFAVGVVLYEALTGRVPFDAATPAAMLAAEGTTPPAPSSIAPDVPRRLDDVVLQALRPRPAERFRNARAMTAALDAAIDATDSRTDDTEVIARADPGAGYVPPLVMPRGTAAPRRPARRRRRSGIGGWIVAAVALAVGAVLVYAIVQAAGPGGHVGSSGSAGASATPSVPAGSVVVPSTIGMSEADGERAATEAGLNWTLRFDTSATEPAGIYDQEPAAGQVVERGSSFVMFAHRRPD